MKSILLFSILLSHLYICRGNNIQVTNISLTGQNTDEDFTMVEFDISWENSWRVIGGPNNWDAAWIFIKYRIGAGPWMHAWLNDTGHTYCEGTITSTGLLDPALPFDGLTNPGMGVFLYRAEPGNGFFECQNVQVRWNYGSQGITDNEQIDIRVFAIEHVYVPEGSFKVGSGGTETSAFYKYPNTTEPFEITSEAEITVGTATDNLYYTPGGISGDALGPIPETFPKGYRAFYVMKYEISQQGYVDFLNTLTRIQQYLMVAVNILGINVTNTFVMANNTYPEYRNGIRCRATIPAQPAPVNFYCDLNSNNIGGEAADGLGIACNFLYWRCFSSYMDWAGLRIMSELELEKCGRGFSNPKPFEYAWGSNVIYTSSSFINLGLPNEASSDPFANVNAPPSIGPVRNGAFAKTTSDRTSSGAGFFGAMDLSGNLAEWAITVGDPGGRSYQGHHGNGELTASGNSDVSFWPGTASGPLAGTSRRGGDWTTVFAELMISDRTSAASVNPGGQLNKGGRGARTAPL